MCTRLHYQAAMLSGVPTALAERGLAEVPGGLYSHLGGTPAPFVALATAFYERVYGDEEWFRGIFANTPKATAIRNQSDFLIERLGGPPLYSHRKGPHALIARHAPYAVDLRAAERWLEHMDAALLEVPAFDADARERLSNFLHHMAYFLVAGKELVKSDRLVGYGGSVHAGRA